MNMMKSKFKKIFKQETNNEHKEEKTYPKLKKLRPVFSYLLVSLISVGLFTGLINYGIIKINNSSSSDRAFVLNSSSGSGIAKVSIGENLTLGEIADKVIPSIVCIQTYTLQSLEVSGEGSGVIMSADGYIITNAHVIEGADNIKVILYDGTTYEAKKVGSDDATDLALIKIEATNLTSAEFGNSDELKVADQVMAVGNPGGLKFSSSVTVGYISALNRSTENGGYTMNSIQTDTAINPGNSGSALVNTYGQVIGVNSSKIVGTGYEGLAFAIPINTVEPIISSLKEYGYVKDRAIIGITYQFIDETTARFYKLVQGIYVNSVVSDNATKAGLKKEDIITEIDNNKITDVSVLTSALAKKKPNDQIKLKVYRNGTYIEITLTLSENTN